MAGSGTSRGAVTVLLGVISDTHGLLRPQATAALTGCDLIIHAGDVGTPAILDALRAIAPIVAVRGNVDGSWASGLHEVEVVEVAGRHLYVLHQVDRLDLDPAAAGLDAVIYGHSHKPSADVKRGVLYLNPGSAGPRRFTLPITLVRLRVGSGPLEPEFVHLEKPA